MWQELGFEDHDGVGDTAVTGVLGCGATLGYEIKGLVFGHDTHSFFEGGAQGLDHGLVGGVVADLVDDLLVGEATQGTEEDSDGDGLPNMRNSRNNAGSRSSRISSPSDLRLERDRELLRWLIGVLSLGSDLSDPGIPAGGFPMKSQDDVICHSLLSYDNFLATINHEVPSLIINTLLSISDDFLIGQPFQMAEIASHHDRDLTKEYLLSLIVISEYFPHGFFLLPIPKGSFFWFYELELYQFGIHVDFCCVGQVTDASFIGEDWHVGFVHFLHTGTVVHVDLVEGNVVVDVFFGLATWNVLGLDLDTVFTMLLDYLLN